MDLFFYITHNITLFLFGSLLSISFSGLKINRKNAYPIRVFILVSLLFQGLVLILTNEVNVRWLYPIITHIPLIFTLCYFYEKRLSTAIVSVTSSYLCCQPANWIGTITNVLIQDAMIVEVSQILALFITACFMERMKDLISQIYNKDIKTVYIFGIVPIGYYLYDYTMSIYTNFWSVNNRVVIEFLPLFLCVIYMIFCLVYYHEEELKKEATKNQQLLRISLDQQSKELDTLKENDNRLRILRHDLRLLLNNLLYSIENDDKETSIHLIKDYITEVDSTVIKRYCSNDTINYVLSNYFNKCNEHDIEFDAKVMVDEISIDNLLFSNILSNALDNAYNAQIELPKKKRQIIVLIKQHNGKLLLSVKNHYNTKPTFVDGRPISKEDGHGYGTQSIQYVTNRLNGVCQFSLQDEYFVLRVII